jgi:hypothetical protein
VNDALGQGTLTSATQELRLAIETVLARGSGSWPRIAEIRRRPFEYQSSYALEDIVVSFEDGTKLDLIFKDLSWHGLSAEGRRVKPLFLLNPLREIAVYQGVLPSHSIPAARYYGSVVAPDGDGCWLFLEKVRGVELYQVGDFALWQEAARWLARMHARMVPAVNTHGFDRDARLVRYDAEFYWKWMNRAAEFSEHSDRQGESRWLHCLAHRYQGVVDRLLGMPVTFIHGEFYASNVLVRTPSNEPNICPVDWEMAGIGPGLVDLAALVIGKWNWEQQRRLALAYHEEFSRDGGESQDFDNFWESLLYCRLHLAVQWLGWSGDWRPPPDHVHDWLAEATRISEELGL